jgi:integrase
MAAGKLTDKRCAGASAKPGERLELPDGRGGPILRVSANSKTWVVRYRTLDGRQPRLVIGEYGDGTIKTPRAKADDPDQSGGEPLPVLSLKDARDEAAAIKRMARGGVDPAAARKQKRAEAKAQKLRTVGDLMEAYFTACEKGTWTPRKKRKRASTLTRERKLYKRHVKARLADLRLEELDRPSLRGFLRELMEAGKPSQAIQSHALLRQALSFAVQEERLASNPAMGLPGVAKAGARTRLLSDAELKAFWSALADPRSLKDADGEPLKVTRRMSIALALVALLLQRRIEVAGMRLDELDLEQATWTIGGGRAKNGKPHLVPLPPRALALIGEALKLNKDAKIKTDFVFPSPRDPQKPFHQDSLTHAMGEIIRALGFPTAGPHDLRRGGATALSSERIGLTPFMVSQILGHTSDAGGGASVTREHYNLHGYASEKRTGLKAWEDLLLEIVGERERESNVTPIRAAVSG